MEYPNQAGVWQRANGDLVDIYPLEPVGDVLFSFGPEDRGEFVPVQVVLK